MKVTKKKLLRRLEWLCKFFKEHTRPQRKRHPEESGTNELSNLTLNKDN